MASQSNIYSQLVISLILNSDIANSTEMLISPI